jgi:hypothetical protein
LELATLIPVLSFIAYLLCGQSSNLDVGGLAHGVTLVLTGIFACIAAFSSLHNGRTLRNDNNPPTQNSRQEGKPAKKKAAPPVDWYQPPDV